MILFGGFPRSGRLFLTRDILLLCLTFVYTGLALSVWSVVYGTCIGRTKAFGHDAKSLATIHGIFIASGEIIGGLAFGILGHMTVKRGRDPIVLFGFLLR